MLLLRLLLLLLLLLMPVLLLQQQLLFLLRWNSALAQGFMVCLFGLTVKDSGMALVCVRAHIFFYLCSVGFQPLHAANPKLQAIPPGSPGKRSR